MLTKTAIERTASGIFLLLVAAIILSILLEVEVDTVPHNFRASLDDVADDRVKYLTSVSFHLLSSFVTVAAGAAFYMLFRLHERALALAAAFGFLAGGVTFMTGDATGLALASLAQEFEVASGTQADAVAASARSTALLGEFAFDIALIFTGSGLVLLGLLILRSGAVHRYLGLLGGLGGLLMTFHWLWHVEDGLIAIAQVGLVITLVFLLLLAGWLILRGTKEAAVAEAS